MEQNKPCILRLVSGRRDGSFQRALGKPTANTPDLAVARTQVTRVEQSLEVGQKTLASVLAEALGTEPRDLVHLWGEKRVLLLVFWLAALSSSLVLRVSSLLWSLSWWCGLSVNGPTGLHLSSSWWKPMELEVGGASMKKWVIKNSLPVL